MYTSLYRSGNCSLPGSEKGRSVSSRRVTSNGGFSSFSTPAALRSRLRRGSGSSWSEKVEKTGLAALRSELTRGVSIFWVSSGNSGVPRFGLYWCAVSRLLRVLGVCEGGLPRFGLD